MTGILVNDRCIDEDDILREMQYHPAEDVAAARRAAAEWLVIRTLLLDRAHALGIDEADESAAVQAVIDSEVDIPEPAEAECRRYYDNNPARFSSPDLVEAAHILLAAAPDDEGAACPGRGAGRGVDRYIERDAGAFRRTGAGPFGLRLETQ